MIILVVGMLSVVVLAAVLVGVFVWLVRRPSGAAGSSQALDIVRERYARGEISREEFEQMQDDLKG